MTQVLRLTLWRIPALLLRPRRCPRCRCRNLDHLPPATFSDSALSLVGVNVYRCHDCGFPHATWRRPRFHRHS